MVALCTPFYYNDPTPTGGTPTRHHRVRDLLPKLPATTRYPLRGVTTTKEPTTDGSRREEGGLARGVWPSADAGELGPLGSKSVITPEGGCGVKFWWETCGRCVFITAGPSTNLFTWGGGGIWEDMCYERRRAEACVDWFLSFGNRTQNSRVAGARPNQQPIGGSDPNHQGIWSPPRAGLGPVRNPVL
jgi:hypothetical protein